MIEPITISEAKVAPLDKGKSSEVENPPRGGKEVQKQPKPLETSQLSELVADLKKAMLRDVDLQFAVHEDTGRVVVTVIEESTGQVIREIPPKEILNIAARFEKMIGVIFDKKG